MVKKSKNTKPNKPRKNIRNGKSGGKIAKRANTKPKRVADARQKIMQKKRTSIVDARDVLASLAKGQDARAKLQKIRASPATKTAAIKHIGKHIIRKTDRNGRISLLTNKKRPTTNITHKIRQQLGIEERQQQQQPKKKSAMVRKDRQGPLHLMRTISNDYAPVPIGYYPQVVYEDRGIEQAYVGMSPMHHIPVAIRRPSMGNMSMGRGLVSDAGNSEWKTTYSSMRPSNDADYMDVDSDVDKPTKPRPAMTRMSSNVHSRLDTATESTSHGIMAQSKTKVVLPVGHRIVVSNLQSTVTQDDIRELFEDIGQLLVARLVRPGTAEVIYKNLKDAQKAVDTYHNRQLDGQPMKCLLVNRRPLNNPTAPAISAESMKKSNIGGRSNNREKLVPDLSTIHKVLFQRH